MTTPIRSLPCCLAALACVGLSGLFIAAQAQTPAPLADVPPSAASAPAAPAASAPVGPRLRTPAETGKRATPPGALSPERPVTPQISIPLGRNQPPATPNEPRPVRRGTPTPAAGGIDDSVARCEAQQDDQVRAACRAKLAREAKTQLPN